MTEGLKLVSINIELNKHLDEVASFLSREQPDVACLQEMVESDMPRFQKALGLPGRFEPMGFPRLPHHLQMGLGEHPFGIAMFSRFPAQFEVLYYHGTPDVVPSFTAAPFAVNRMFLHASVTAEGKAYSLGTTHLTWTEGGEANERQRQATKLFLSVFKRFPNIVFCGDVSAPRGKEIWSMFSARYKDNIPLEYDSSLDPNLHRLKDHKKFVVDGLFSTPEYVCHDTKLVEGISDHMAIVSQIERSS